MKSQFLTRAIVVAVIVMIGPVGRVVYAQNGYPQRQSTYINDFANLLTPEAATSIQSALENLSSTSGIDAVVVTIQSINDYGTGDTSIESFATHLFNTWGVGNVQTNRGVMILVAVQDRKVRIQLGVGYGSSYNSLMQNVIDNQMLPAFREGQYSQGIEQGVQGVIESLTTVTPQEMLIGQANAALVLSGLVIGMVQTQ